MLFPRDRERASPYHPSDRRFLDPIFIDVLDDAACRATRRSSAALAALAPAFAAASTTSSCRVRGGLARQARGARSAERGVRRACARRGPAIRSSPTTMRSRDRAAKRCGASRSSRRPPTRDAGEDWRLWPQDLRDGDPKALDRAIERNRRRLRVRAVLPMARRPAAWRAAARAREGGGLEIGLYRDLAVGAAPDGAESWSRAGRTRASASRVGAPPDPFSAQGQNWHLPAPNPIAGAREGWRVAQRALPRQHAPRRHAADRSRDGADAAVRHPRRRQARRGRLSRLSRSTISSARSRWRASAAECMIVGEDLGTVPEGFRDRLDARQHPRECACSGSSATASISCRPPNYPPLSVACASTHDLPTLAGWWQGADIAERLMLGLSDPGEAGNGDRGAARGEARARRARLLAAGLIGSAPSSRRPMTDALAAAVQALHRRVGLDLRQRPIRRPRRRDGRDQPARHRSRAPELARSGGPGCRRRLRGPSRAGDPRGAGQGADVTERACECALLTESGARDLKGGEFAVLRNPSNEFCAHSTSKP